MEAYILGGVRTPFTKSFTHYRGITTQELMLASLRPLVERFGLQGKTLGDVALGAVVKGPLDWNLARECVLHSGLHPYTPGYDVQRACGTSLETTNQLALKISAKQMQVAIAGGVDTNSDATALFSRRFRDKALDLRDAPSLLTRLRAALRFRPSDFLPVFPGVAEPTTKLSMGEHTEKMVKEWRVSRQEQDELALLSHQNAARAYAEGFYDDLVTEFRGLKKDTLVRAETSMEKLAKLKPAFDRSGGGTLTAGNSSPLTDGSAAVLLASREGAESLGLKPQARFLDCEVAAVDLSKGMVFSWLPPSPSPA